MAAESSPSPRIISPVPPAPEAPSPAPARGNWHWIILGGVTTAVLVLLGGYLLFTSNRERTDDAQVDADVVGLSTRVGGTVLHVAVEDNAGVKKGDLLVEIDPSEYQARARQAQAELDTAEAQAKAADAQAKVVEAGARGGLFSAKAKVDASTAAASNADSQVAAAQATLERAQAEAKRAERELARARQLKAADALPQERLDDAETGHDAAEANLAQAKAQLSASVEMKRSAFSRIAEAKGMLDESAPIEAKIGAARAAAELAHAGVAAAEAALDQAKLQLSYTRVVAPTDGQVSRLTAREGQLLAAGQSLAELVPNQTYVVANFKETQVVKMRAGQRAEVEVDGFRKPLQAKVQSLAGGTGARFSLLPPDNASGNFVKVVQRVPVRLVWDGKPPALPLRAGLSAEVTLYIE